MFSLVGVLWPRGAGSRRSMLPLLLSQSLQTQSLRCPLNIMAKGNRKKKTSKQHAMDADDEPPQQWQAGVSAETGEQLEGMDTGDFGAKLKPQSQKVQQAKRGQRTRAQKRRKSDKLEKALAFVSKMEKKEGRGSASTQARKQAKSLWVKGEEGGE